MDELFFSIFMMIMLMGGIPLIIHSFRRVDRNERKEIRQQYTELIKEKLDVIRTAMAMGQDSDEIAHLDRRLERLIGTEKMLETLKKPTTETISEASYLAAKDIVEEMDKDRTSSKWELDA